MSTGDFAESLYLGIDVGGTNIKAGVVDDSGNGGFTVQCAD